MQIEKTEMKEVKFLVRVCDICGLEPTKDDVITTLMYVHVDALVRNEVHASCIKKHIIPLFKAQFSAASITFIP